MPKYVLPFDEYQRGWYEIVADTLEAAKAIANSDDIWDYEANYQKGHTDWDIDEMYQVEEFPSESWTK